MKWLVCKKTQENVLYRFIKGKRYEITSFLGHIRDEDGVEIVFYSGIRDNIFKPWNHKRNVGSL
jgi:hypothetical protein